MASEPFALSLLLTLSLLSLTATAVPEDELSSALTALRNHGGYSLFANAVATSDLYFTLLTDPSLSSFTLLAPPDSSVYSLDVTSSSSDEYLSALRRHVVPRRLSLLSLRTAPAAGSDIPTLDPRRFLRIQTRPSSEVVSVSGVDVTSPGIFYGRSVAVHGLGGSVVPRHRPPTPSDLSDRTVSVSPVVPRQQSHPPPIFSDRTVSDHLVADSPENSDSHVVPRHQSPTTSEISDRTVSDHLVANSPRNPDSPVEIGQVEVSPASSIGVSPVGLDTSPAYVAGSVRKETVVGHVIMARGNTYRLEKEEEEPMLTCPYL